jgi:hypothetical protein
VREEDEPRAAKGTTLGSTDGEGLARAATEHAGAPALGFEGAHREGQGLVHGGSPARPPRKRSRGAGCRAPWMGRRRGGRASKIYGLEPQGSTITGYGLAVELTGRPPMAQARASCMMNSSTRGGPAIFLPRLSFHDGGFFVC